MKLRVGRAHGLKGPVSQSKVFYYLLGYKQSLENFLKKSDMSTQACLGNIAGLVPDHRNTANIEIK